jgi:hypothetical protein
MDGYGDKSGKGLTPHPNHLIVVGDEAGLNDEQWTTDDEQKPVHPRDDAGIVCYAMFHALCAMRFSM